MFTLKQVLSVFFSFFFHIYWYIYSSVVSLGNCFTCAAPCFADIVYVCASHLCAKWDWLRWHRLAVRLCNAEQCPRAWDSTTICEIRIHVLALINIYFNRGRRNTIVLLCRILQFFLFFLFRTPFWYVYRSTRLYKLNGNILKNYTQSNIFCVYFIRKSVFIQ